MVIVDLILQKNRNFYAQLWIFQNSQKSHFDLNFLHKIDIKIASVVLVFQNVWSSRSIRTNQISTDCSVLTDSVFFVLCAYFDGSIVFFDEFLP